MKVKCIKTSIKNNSPRIINRDVEGYLTVGDIFFVYGLRFDGAITYIYLYEGEHLIEVPLELFEIIDNRVEKSWIIKYNIDGDCTFWPELFYENNFLENFVDREKEERDKFFLLQNSIEKG